MSNHESGGNASQGVRRTLTKIFGGVITIGLALFLGLIIGANLMGLRFLFISNTMHGTQLIGTVLVSVVLIIAAIYGLVKL